MAIEISNELGDLYMVSAGDTETIAIDYTDILDGTEALTGTPTIVEPTTTGVVLDNKQLNSAAITVLGRSVAANNAVQCSAAFSSTMSGTTKTIRVTISTNGSPARTWVRDVKIKVV